jgi:hypothetical protein
MSLDQLLYSGAEANYPVLRPSLDLYFAKTKTLDPRISFIRNSSATYVDAQGIIRTAGPNQPRFDHNPETGESLGLLMEESRTNIFTSSTSFGGMTYQNGYSFQANTAIAPDMSLTAARVRISNSSMNSWKFTSTTIGNTYTLSCWVKSNSKGSRFNMEVYAAPGVNITNTFTATDKWKRFSMTVVNYPLSYAEWRVCKPLNLNVDYYIWGPQLEQGANLTSYIPTQASAVTRSSDIASITGTNFTNWYNQNEGTFFVSGTMVENVGNPSIISFTNPYYSPILTYGIYWIWLPPGGGGQYGGPIDSTYKAATVLYGTTASSNGYTQLSVNGQKCTTLTNSLTPAWYFSQNSLLICSFRGPGNPIYGKIKRITYWPKRLPANQLEAITK